MTPNDTDILMRLAAFKRVEMLSKMHGHLTHRELSTGFTFQGERIPLVNPQRGIFKPRQMRYLLSIKTVIPKPGGRVWYDDQSEAHDQIYDGDDGIDYAFMGSDPNAADNQWLRAAYENQVGVIYFLGIAPGRYQPIWPVYIADWDAKALKARWTARCAERISAFQGPSRRLRCLPHRHRSRLSHPQTSAQRFELLENEVERCGSLSDGQKFANEQG